MLELQFGAATLHALRDSVLTHAMAAGMSRERAVDVMLTLHELAANTVRHGAGSGWLRMRIAAGTLCCQVSDPGTADCVQPWWSVEEGHGLWLVREAADQVSVVFGPGRSEVTVMFALQPA